MKPIQQKDIDSMLLLPSYFESEIYNEKEKQVIHHFLLANQLNQGTSYWSQKRLKWNKKQKKEAVLFSYSREMAIHSRSLLSFCST